MKILIVLMIVVCCVFLPRSSVYAVGMAKVTIKVVDEEQKPVPDAEIQLCFVGGCLKKDIVHGATDSDGIYIVSGFSIDGVVGGTALKDGYYYTTFNHDFITTTLGMYQPWNKEIKVVLRPMIKPVPMYVRDKWVTIPVVAHEIGFDLQKFDWVAPHGLGTVADLIFMLDSRYKSFDDRSSTLTITFSNKFDGIQPFELDMGGDFGVGSGFRTPRYAPENGYQNKFVTKYSSKSLPVYRTTYPYFFFRVRSEVDNNGNFKRAIYGKLQGDLEAVSSKNGLARIHFCYWLNPDYTTNMEFDIDRNLFSPLPKGETNIRLP